MDNVVSLDNIMLQDMVIKYHAAGYGDIIIMLQGNCEEAARCYALANAAQSEWPQVGRFYCHYDVMML